MQVLTALLFLQSFFGMCLVRAEYPQNNVPEECFQFEGAWVPTQHDPITSGIRCISNDGTHCIWLGSKDQCLASSAPTYLECGDQHKSIYGATGYEDPQSWCSQAKSYFIPGSSTPRTPSNENNIPTRVILGEPNQVQFVPEQAWGNSPDGNMVSIPYGDTFALYYPNAKNYRHLCQSPYFQDVPDDNFQLVYGWVPCSNPDKFNTFYAAGMWIFAVFPASDRLIGLGHAESGISASQGCQGAGSGDITYKTITVSYSYDSGQSWSDPQIIISAGSLDTSQPTTMWSGAGDPGFIQVGGEIRAYFYYSGRLSFARTFDPLASPGSWQVLKNDGSWVDANHFGGDLMSLPNVPVGPNPHITYSTYFSKFIMTIWQWSSPYLTFLWSSDGINWTLIETIFIRDDILSRPLYPTVVSSHGSSVIGNEGFLYYARWSSPTFRTMTYRTIRFEA